MAWWTSERGREAGTGWPGPLPIVSLVALSGPSEGPLAEVNGVRPEDSVYQGPAERLQDVWVAARSACLVLESVTLADIVEGDLPAPITELLERPDAWLPRPLGPSSRS